MRSFTQAPYSGLPWVLWLYAVTCCLLYCHYGVFAGRLTGFDDPVRLTQVLAWINGAGFYDHTLLRANPPEGLTTIWSRLVDIPIALVIIIAQTVVDQKTAALTSTVVVPFIELAVLFQIAPYFARPVIGKQNARLILLFLIFTSVLNVRYFSIAGFHTGEASHRAWYVILDLALFGAAGRLALGLKRGIIAATLSIGLLLAVGIEGIPMIGGMCALLATLSWFFYRPKIAALGAKAAAAGALFGFLLLPLYRSPLNMLDVSYAEPSIVGPTLVACAALFLCVEVAVLKLIGASRKYLSCAVLVTFAAILGALLLALFPGLSSGPGAGLSPEERLLAFSQHFEVMPLYKVATSPLDFLALVGPSILAIIGGLISLTTTSSSRRRSVYALYLGVSLVTSGLAQELSRYFHHAMTTSCVWLLWLWDHIKTKLLRNKHYTLKAFFVFVALGPLAMLILPAIDRDQPFASNILFFPARNQVAPNLTCDLLPLARYLNEHYPDTTILSVPSWDSATFLFNTNLRIDFVALYPSHNKFIDSMIFLNTQDPDAARKIAAAHQLDLVAACKYADVLYQPEIRSRPGRTPMFLELLQEETPLPWLRRVKDVPGNYLLYEVIKDKVR